MNHFNYQKTKFLSLTALTTVSMLFTSLPVSASPALLAEKYLLSRATRGVSSYATRLSGRFYSSSVSDEWSKGYVPKFPQISNIELSNIETVEDISRRTKFFDPSRSLYFYLKNLIQPASHEPNVSLVKDDKMLVFSLEKK